MDKPSALTLTYIVRPLWWHVWNGDHTRFAVCSGNNAYVCVVNKQHQDYRQENVLVAHEQMVISIDWSPKTNRIVTVSLDKTANVWKFDERTNVWIPHLVILDIRLGATHVKWSPNESKFAVASSAKCVAVCHYAASKSAWVTERIFQHDSTVLKVEWHPNNIYLATGSTDCKLRIFSAYIDGIDQNSPTSAPFGSLLCEIDTGSWVRTLKWSPSGKVLAFATQDASISFAILGHPKGLCFSHIPSTRTAPKIQKIRLKGLGIRDILFWKESRVVAAGDDASPFLFSCDREKWTFTSELDNKYHPPPPRPWRGFWNTRRVLTGPPEPDPPPTLHQSAITCIQPLGESGDFSTSGTEGGFAVWNAEFILWGKTKEYATMKEGIWNVKNHFLHPPNVRNAIMCFLLMNKSQQWGFDGNIMHKIFEMVAFQWRKT